MDEKGHARLFYRLSPLGEEVLRAEALRLERLVGLARQGASAANLESLRGLALLARLYRCVQDGRAQMQEPRVDINEFGQAWVALADTAASCEDGCLKADEIWDGARGKLPVAQTRRLVDHLARCPACAESWQLARLISQDAEAASPTRLRSALVGWPRWAAAVAAMILLAALGMQRWASQMPVEPPFRQASQIAIRSLLPEESTLPRDEFVLEWTPVASDPSARYRLTVTSESLDIIYQAADLQAPRCQVPAQRFSSLASGTLLQWQVMATTEDGARFKSPTFLNRLQ